MTSIRKHRVLIAGDLDPRLEDAIFRQGRLSGLQCARVSGHEAWGTMLRRCRFDAVILGLPEDMPYSGVSIPGTKIYVVSGKPPRRGKGAFFYEPQAFSKALPAIISEISGKRSGATPASGHAQS